MSARGTIARIEALRIERGWSQAQLSDRAGLGKGAVNDLANHPDRQPRPATLARIAAALGVAVEYLTDAPEPGADDLDPDGAAALFDRIAAMLRGGAGAVRVAGDGAMGGDMVAVIDRAAGGASGDLVAVDSDHGPRIGYVAEPYIVTRGQVGALRHALRGGDGGQVIGRVLCLVALKSPDLAGCLRAANVSDGEKTGDSR